MRELLRILVLIAALCIAAIGLLLGVIGIALSLLSGGPDQLMATTLSASLLVLSLGLGLAYGSWTRACAGTSCPSIAALEGYRPTQTAKVYAADGRLITELGVERVIATTYQDNLASRRVMEKAGMTLTRTFRLTAADLHRVDTYHVASQDPWDGDDVEYSLQKADWEQQESAAPPPA